MSTVELIASNLWGVAAYAVATTDITDIDGILNHVAHAMFSQIHTLEALFPIVIRDYSGIIRNIMIDIIYRWHRHFTRQTATVATSGG